MMSAYSMSIGEPELSQDTPLRNTTPLGKRQRVYGSRPGVAKKLRPEKMNQCQLCFYTIWKSNDIEENIYSTFEPVDEELDSMAKKLENGNIYNQATKDDDDELQWLVQELEKKAKATKESKGAVSAKVTELAMVSGSQQSQPLFTEGADHNESHDDAVVRACTMSYQRRTEAFESALENTEKVKRQVENFKGELGQVRAKLLKQVEQVRLEYEARLSQQRKELKEDARKPKEEFNNLLKEQQRIVESKELEAQRESDYGQFVLDRIHLKNAWKENMKTYLAAEWSSRVADADAEIAYLSSKLAAADDARKNATSLLAATQDQVKIVDQKKNQLRKTAQSLSGKNEALYSTLRSLRAECGEKTKDADHRLRESSRMLQDARNSLAESNDSATWARNQLTTSRSDYATLLIDVVLVQKQKLSVARDQTLQLSGNLAESRSTVKELEGTVGDIYSKLKATVSQVENKKKLLVSRTRLIEELQNASFAGQQRLDQTEQAAQNLTKNFKNAKMQFETALKAKDDLLAFNATQISDQTLKIQNLTHHASNAVEELRVERSNVACRDEQIRALERANEVQDTSIEQLRSMLDLREQELQAKASTSRSHETRIRELENANQGLLEKQAETNVRMTQLVTETVQVRSEIDTNKEELKSQSTLLSQRSVTISDLEAANKRLSEAKANTGNEMMILRSRLSTFALDLKIKNDELQSGQLANRSKSASIDRLKAENAQLLKAQEKANTDTVSTVAALHNANCRIDRLETELEARTARLGNADMEIERLRRSLQQVGDDLSAEKSANRTASLEKSIADAEFTIETLSLDLSRTTECLERVRASSNSLASAMDSGRVFPGVTAGEDVMVQAFKFCGERRALMIIQSSSHMRIVWNESLDRCTIEMVKWVWCLRLHQREPDAAPDGVMEVWIKPEDCPGLERWLKGSDSAGASVRVNDV